MRATSIVDSIQVIEASHLGNNVYYFTVTCFDHDTYEKLPAGAEYDGRVYGKIGWNSDSCIACYKTGVKFARVVK